MLPRSRARTGEAIPRELINTREKKERAILVGVELKGRRHLWALEDSLEELAQLAYSAGAEVASTFTQRVEQASPYYLGKGKLEGLKALIMDKGAGVTLFDDELTPNQQRNLEEVLGIKVIDRTALILDVFARQARTREGRLQVELAQHQYLLPRLVGQWSHLERLGGGIGTRGPGESQLETDRRLIRKRIQRLKEELEAVSRHRALYRSQRKKEGIPVISLVGYTNAGKSTLLNSLTKAGVMAEDRLFSTLDPVTRRIRLPSGQEALLTDTVGFIQKLPPAVVAAFRATLEELQEANLILHVVDITHHNAAEQVEVVEAILKELGLKDKLRVMALNKTDLIAGEPPTGKATLLEQPVGTSTRGVAWISAAKGWGLDKLLEILDQEVRREAVATTMTG